MHPYKREQSEQEYTYRINKVIDYIKENLHKELSVEHLAQVACFSKFHFHRIFSDVVGETVNQFVKKTRIERAAFCLSNQPHQSITEIAMHCGFLSLTSFSRAFKEEIGMSARAWREQSINRNSKNGKLNSNPGKIGLVSPAYLAQVNINSLESMKTDPPRLIVQVKEQPTWLVAYIRHLAIDPHDSYEFEKMFERLFRWAIPRELVQFPDTKAFTIYRSNPALSSNGKVQADVAISVPEGTTSEGEIGVARVTGGKYAVIHCESTVQESIRAWNYVSKEWLPQNGYRPDERHFYLNHLNDPKEHPQQFHILDMCIPVTPL